MTMPSEARGEPGIFDRFANAADRFSSRAWYFTLCVLIVILWACSFPLFSKIDTWQLIINTGTTIITFWMVALQRSVDRRDSDSQQQKWNAQILAQQEVLKRVCAIARTSVPPNVMRELDAALGLENRETE